MSVSFFDLSDAEIESVLAGNHVGRLAFSHERRVDIEPISYVYHDRFIYVRTGPGTKLTQLAHRPWIAFQVDEIQGPFDWKSVVVHGTVYRMRDEGTPEQRAAYAMAVELVQKAFPGALTPDDPVPERAVLMRINTDERVGKGARTT